MMTTKSSKRRDEKSADRISNLPREVIDDIVASMPIRDAGRTSILSRYWKHIWTENPQIVINEQFYRATMARSSSKEFHEYFLNIVNILLMQHLGPIHKFVLEIPDSLPSIRHFNIDQWILFLTRQGLEELTIYNSSSSSSIAYKIPSYIFSCTTLKKMSISKCIVFEKPTPDYSFEMITCLTLEGIKFDTGHIVLPKLVSLTLQNCRDTYCFNPYPPQLNNLELINNDDLDLNGYMFSNKLGSVHIELSSGDNFQCEMITLRIPLSNFTDVTYEKITLTNFPRYWPALTKLTVNASFLKYVAAGCTIFPEEHTTETNEYLGETTQSEQSALRLTTVKITNFEGSIAELFFVKHILANCPSLERLCIKEKNGLDPLTRLQATKQLMLFPRVSTKAEMIFVEGKTD